MKSIACLLVMVAIIIAGGGIVHANPPDPAAEVYTTITCTGTQNVCFTYNNGTTDVSVPGNLVKVESDGSGRTLSCGSSETSVTNVFLYTPGSTTNGVGYIGAAVCLDATNRTGEVLTNTSTQVYTNIGDWHSALP